MAEAESFVPFQCIRNDVIWRLKSYKHDWISGFRAGFRHKNNSTYILIFLDALFRIVAAFLHLRNIELAEGQESEASEPKDEKSRFCLDIKVVHANTKRCDSVTTRNLYGAGAGAVELSDKTYHHWSHDHQLRRLPSELEPEAAAFIKLIAGWRRHFQEAYFLPKCISTEVPHC
ncbi:hypothetical protein F2Q69_00033066 [Brassica cretica]|uniref:Uncharacterized protein n=1 Tax=Brassica cretica TaxID=69181 RepID=A0A8S9SG69_BRACR|nr:hypothetical protein F2Q69_00033066 [Brassica cretica]